MGETKAIGDERIVKICGPAQSGKTQLLIDRCVELAAAGADAASILVLTSTGMAAQAFAARLEAALPQDNSAFAAKVRICTPIELCQEILSTKEAQKATGRTPRLLNRAEYKFLQEDLKVLGASNRKVRAALSYYFKQMSALVPRDEWVLLGEEHTVIKRLESSLIGRDAVLVQEIGAIAANYLQSEAGKDARGAYAHVFADDFQNMSKAEQVCACMSAKDQLAVAGNVNQCVNLNEVTPNPDGFAHFEDRRDGVSIITLNKVYGNPNVAKMAQALCAYGDMDQNVAASIDDNDAAEKVIAVKWDSPEKELDALTKYLRMQINDIKDAHESRTCVVVPNARWAHLLGKVLAQRGFTTSLIGAGEQIGGDPREADRCKAQIAYTKLCLLADPNDITAWRSWLGFGNFLLNSDLWAKLEECCEQSGRNMLDELAHVAAQAKEPFPKSHVFAERYKQAQTFIKKDRARRGFALMRAIGADKLPEFANIMAQLAGDESATDIAALMRKSFFAPQFPENNHILRIMYPQYMVGLSADNVYVFGCVDGFYPSRDAFEVVSTPDAREKVLNDDRRAFYTAISKAQDKLIVSFFSKSNLELAEKSKMQVLRVKADKELDRVALVRMSQFLTETGDAYPGTTSGQQLLAEYGLD